MTDNSHRDLLHMNRAASGSSCVSTCFGVGGDEDVRGVRTKRLDSVKVVGDVVHERNPSDRDEREANDGVFGLQNGLAVGDLFLLGHGWHCQEEAEKQKLKFNCKVSQATAVGRFLWEILSQLQLPSLCQTFTVDLFIIPTWDTSSCWSGPRSSCLNPGHSFMCVLSGLLLWTILVLSPLALNPSPTSASNSRNLSVVSAENNPSWLRALVTALPFSPSPLCLSL